MSHLRLPRPGEKYGFQPHVFALRTLAAAVKVDRWISHGYTVRSSNLATGCHVTSESVRFGVGQHVIEVNFERSKLRLGAEVHVVFNDFGVPLSIISKRAGNTVPHWVAWIAPSEWYVKLEEKFKLRDEYIQRVASAVSAFVDPSVVTKALSRFASEIRPQFQFKTSEFERNPLSIVFTVVERLDVVNKIDGALREENPLEYKEYLLSYLMLTCFDRLGQPADWRDFGMWIQSAEAASYYEENVNNEEGIASVRNIYEAYQKKYGVKNSFFRFFNDILTDDARAELCASIEIVKLSNPPSIRELPRATELEKLRYLYKRRNDYTHKASFIPRNGERYSRSYTNHVQEFTAEWWSDTVTHNWPYILVTTVRRGLAQFLLNATINETSPSSAHNKTVVT